MCNHQFKITNKSDIPRCTVQEILDCAKGDTDTYFELDFDTDGVCLFHSTQIEWKRQQGFAEKFEKLILIAIQHKLSLRFQEFQFVATQKAIVIEDKTVVRHLIFKGCFFHDILILQNLNIEKCVFTIEDCDFEKGLVINNSNIDTFNIFNVYAANFTMTHVKVLYGAAMFNSFTCNEVFRLSECYFENTTNFNDTEFLDERDGFYGEHLNVVFDKNVFVGEVDFSGAKFTGSVDFKDIDFAGGVKFIDTIFSFTRPLTFDTIRINERGMMQFRGLDVRHKLFNSEVRFFIKEDDIKGIIVFENVNFQNIAPSHKEMLLSFQKSGKVEIGKGCIKYRHQTPTKKIKISAENQDLAIELANTFVQFFKNKNGLNLGVEVVGQDKESIDIFYFTDADISYAEFQERLIQSSDSVWTFIKVSPLNQEGIVLKEKDPKTKEIMPVFDSWMRFLFCFFRIGLQMMTDKKKGERILNIVPLTKNIDKDSKIIQVQQITNNIITIMGDNNSVVQDSYKQELIS